MKEERILQTTALYCLAVMIIVIFVGIAINYQEKQKLLAEELTPEPTMMDTAPTPTSIPFFQDNIIPDMHADIEAGWSVWNVLLTERKEELEGLLGDKSVIIRKPEDGELAFSLSTDLLKHSMEVVISGAEQGTVSPISILRISGEECFIGLPERMLELERQQSEAAEEEMTEQQDEQEEKPTEIPELSSNGDLLQSMEIEYAENEEDKTTTLSMIFDGYFLPEIHETPEYYIIALRRPKELYDKIVVIDAGHGGHDPGAGAENWRITEASLNLKMLLYLKEYLDADTSIQAYYTRTGNTYPTLAERVELANGVEADLFISIHCNSTVQSRSNGSEVMYNAEQGLGDAFCSRDFAKICLSGLTEVLGTKSGGIIKRPDLHIVRRAEMPVALLETAYMSNANDLMLLKDETKLQAVGEAIYQAILEAYRRMEDSTAE